MNNKKKILAAIIIVVAVVLLCVGGVNWYKHRMARVATGTARPTFPYTDYSKDELDKLYPQYTENTAPTTQTPEETYKKLREAIVNNDSDFASSLFIGQYKDQYGENFQEAKTSGELIKLIDKLEPNILKDEARCDVGKCVYFMSTSKNEIHFLKNDSGVWLIESI